MTTIPGAIPLLEFQVGGLRLALPITSVRNLIEYRMPVAIPAARAGVLGLVWENGIAIPVIDLAAILGREESAPTLLVIARTEEALLAFPIARVESIPSLTMEHFVHAGFCEVPIPSRFVRAVGLGEESQVIVLNLSSLDDAFAPRLATGSLG